MPVPVASPILLLAASIVAASGPRSAAYSDPQDRAQPAGEEPLETRPFRIPDHGAARSRSESAEVHLAARRWSEALADLQGLLETHRGDLLGSERPLTRANRPSQQPVHAGAARRARERLWSLPEDARRLYRERHEAEARLAFERAREQGDRGALPEVARRWPLTASAERAWWALGDLEHERGDADKARAAWGRALEAALADADLDLSNPEGWKRARDRLGAAPARAGDPPAHAGEPPARAGEPAARAGDQAQRASEPEDRAGIEIRIEVAIRDLEGAADPSRPRASTWADGLRPSTARVGALPRAERDAWAEPFKLDKEHPYNPRRNAFFPARAGEVVLVSNSLRLTALNAWSGTPVWDSGEPDGWSELQKAERSELLDGVDREAGLVAPAAGDHVAVAALQLPLAFVQKDMFQNIRITTPMPERRLFAFDLRSGRKLWSHEPPAGWDGESGSFLDRMTVAGPPTVCGSRVLAPFCRIQGRIDYHVGCVDLDTGELLWSTPLISGQRELNMFGRAEHEFCAPPIVVAGDVAIALTQLGAIAALDLFTGEIRWETLYNQIPIPRNTHTFRAAARHVVWKNAPPAIVGSSASGLVVATPFDSRELIGVDLRTGALVWSLPHETIRTLSGERSADIHLLVGARDTSVYLFGDRVLALSARGGLALQAPNTFQWAFDEGSLADSATGRPVLCGDRIVVPTVAARVELELDQGRAVAKTPWGENASGGNLVLGPGEVYAVTSQSAFGWFDWDGLLARARSEVAARPGDLPRAATLAQMLFQRGLGAWERGESEAARRHLEEAESVLAPALSRAAGESLRPLSADLHRILRAQARVRASLADRAGALARLRRARALAPDAAALRDTLLEELALQPAPAAAPAAREAVLAELERACGDLPILCGVATQSEPPGAERQEPGTERPVPGTERPVPGAERQGPGAEFQVHGAERRVRGALPRFVPLVGSPITSELVPCEMPVGLWVLLERLAGAPLESRTADEFGALHAILERFPDVELPDGRAGDLAATRIASLLGEGRRQGYAEFEARAQERLSAALAGRDRATLAHLARLFPGSKAGERADDLRLEWALADADAGEVARIVQSALPRSWRLESAAPREVGLCLSLSRVFALAGNRELSTALLRALAARFPESASPFPEDAGRTLADLAAEAAPARPDAAPESGAFVAGGRAPTQWPGDHEILGTIPLEASATGPDDGTPAGTERILLLAHNSLRQPARLVALSSADPTRIAWDLELPDAGPIQGSSTWWWSRHAAFAAGRALIAVGGSVLALDTAGVQVWSSRPAPSGSSLAARSAGESVAVACSSGVAVLSIETEGGRRILKGIDARSGVELWTETAPAAWFQPLPLCSESRAVLLPTQGRRGCVVLDLFTGRRSLVFDLDAPAAPAIHEDAWIEDDRLIVPWFSAARLPDRNQVVAVDLSSGARAWRIGFGEGAPTDRASTERASTERAETAPDRRDLHAVFQRDGRTWLYVRPLAGVAGAPSGAVYELSTRIGALSPIAGARIGDSDLILGLTRPGRLRLASHLIFLLSQRKDTTEVRLRALDLSRGEVWSQPLPVRSEGLYPGPIPQPAVSDSVVAVAYTVSPQRQPQTGPSTRIDWFDRASGLPLAGSTHLPPQAGLSGSIGLVPLGDALIVRGQSILEVR